MRRLTTKGIDDYLIKNVVLYHYCEYDIVVLNIQDEWIEVF